MEMKSRRMIFHVLLVIYVISIISLTDCYGQINVSMVGDKDDISVVGENITLICNYSPKTLDRRVSWQFGSDPLLASLDCDNGICQTPNAAPPHGVLITGHAGDKVLILTEGEIVEVNCITRAVPPAAVEWIIPESVQVFNITRQSNKMRPDSYLCSRRANVSPSRDAHGERLYCKVSHPQLQEPIETSVLLNVQAPPTSIEISIPSMPIREDGSGVQKIIIFKGTLTNITCTSNGSRPAANISWTLNANKISNDVTSHNTSNPVDETSEPPEIDLPNKLMDGEDTRVTCSTGSGYPAPLVHWYIGSRNITNQSWPNQIPSDHGRASIMSTLVFTPTKADNGRNLTCETTQMMAFTTLSHLSQKVLRTLEIHYPPVIRELNFRHFVTDVTFTCLADASLSASNFTWFRNGSSLDSSNGHQQQHTEYQKGNTTSSSKLTIGGVTSSDQGEYKCEASTNLGRDSSAINYTFASTPQAPSDLKVQQKQTTSSTIIVAWQPGFYGGFQQTYTLQYCKYENEDPGQKVCYHKADINSTNYTLRNLKPYSRYEIILWSANKAGNSGQKKIVSSTAPKDSI
nr:nephrin-like [Lytechinus pictus]